MSTSTKPYFVRALYEWCLDNGHTPYLACSINAQARVPAHLAREAQVVFNIGPNATPNLQIDNEWVNFSARFNGVSEDIWLPVGQIVGIYAKETGEGMGFHPEAEDEHDNAVQSQASDADTSPNAPNKDQAAAQSDPDNPPPKRGLRLVK